MYLSPSPSLVAVEAEKQYGKDKLKIYRSSFTPMYHGVTTRKTKCSMKLITVLPEEKVNLVNWACVCVLGKISTFRHFPMIMEEWGVGCNSHMLKNISPQTAPITMLMLSQHSERPLIMDSYQVIRWSKLAVKVVCVFSRMGCMELSHTI